MEKWKHVKMIRKFYEITKKETQDEEGYIEFFYCNWTYSHNSVNLINMLTAEVKKDFPNVSTDYINVQRRNHFPNEIVLIVTFTLSEIKDLNLSKFEELPKDFW